MNYFTKKKIGYFVFQKSLELYLLFNLSNFDKFYSIFLQLLALQKEQDELMTGNGNGGNPPKVNICPPSPQNNDPDKTGNFS